MVKARLWLAGEVSEHRDRTLIRRQIARVHACAQHRSLLFCTDDLCSYIWAIRGTFRDPVHTGVQRRPWLRPWRNVCIAQVVKRSGHRRCADQYTLATRILGLSRRSPSGNLAGRDGQAGLPDRSGGASCLKQHHCENGGKCCLYSGLYPAWLGTLCPKGHRHRAVLGSTYPHADLDRPGAGVPPASPGALRCT